MTGMVDGERSLPVDRVVPFHAAPIAPPGADFDSRWAAWVVRGRLHERRVRRASFVWAAGLAIVLAIVYLILR